MKLFLTTGSSDKPVAFSWDQAKPDPTHFSLSLYLSHELYLTWQTSTSDHSNANPRSRRDLYTWWVLEQGVVRSPSLTFRFTPVATDASPSDFEAFLEPRIHANTLKLTVLTCDLLALNRATDADLIAPHRVKFTSRSLKADWARQAKPKLDHHRALYQQWLGSLLEEVSL